MSDDNRRMEAPKTGVKVRMYRQGLGDCFLLAFRASDGGARYMLIDCGVLRSTPDEKQTMEKVMENIRAATGGHLHVLVVTHEHYDHFCGFSHAEETFRQIEIDEVWLAWTEDSGHPFAAQMHRAQEEKRRAVQAAAQRLREAKESGAETVAAHLDALFSFSEAAAAADAEDEPATGFRSAKALQIVRSRVEKPRFCRPGLAPLSVPGVEGVRIYVLGPPENDIIKKSNPTKRGQEVYDLAAARSVEGAFLEAARHSHEKNDDLSSDDREQRDLNFPFDKHHQLRFEDVEKNVGGRFSWFHRHYFVPPVQLKMDFESEMEPKLAPEQRNWRRIDHDWLGAAGALALKLDSDTNNTSLALAIELGDGQVLLFPADAQVGNWLSWEGLSWPARDAGKPPVTTLDLLRRTVLYKVGHHASHNATLRAKGLELMESPDLVALIPVDEEVARRQGVKGWDMPFPPLLRRLSEKTRGRVIRSDKGKPKQKHDLLSAAQWHSFDKRTVQTDLWVELSVEERSGE